MKTVQTKPALEFPDGISDQASSMSSAEGSPVQLFPTSASLTEGGGLPTLKVTGPDFNTAGLCYGDILKELLLSLIFVFIYICV